MDRLDRIIGLLEDEVPGVRLIHKADSLLMHVLAVLLRPLVPDFMTGYATALFGNIYLPAPVSELDRRTLAVTVAHELIHLRDERRLGFVFWFSYVLTPVPVFRTHRAHWERRGYAVDLLIAYEEGGDPALERTAERLAEVFSGPAYGWMWAPRAAARAWLAPIVEEVREGTFQEREPYRRILKAWRGG